MGVVSVGIQLAQQLRGNIWERTAASAPSADEDLELARGPVEAITPPQGG
jgi:hypothetical protein